QTTTGGAPVGHPLHQLQAKRGAPLRVKAGGPVAAAVAGGTIVVDQVVKIIAVALWEKAPQPLGPVRLLVTRNPGSAFSLFPGLWWLVMVAVVVVTLVAVNTLRRPHHLLLAVSLGLVLGGAWSNLFD